MTREDRECARQRALADRVQERCVARHACGRRGDRCEESVETAGLFIEARPVARRFLPMDSKEHCRDHLAFAMCIFGIDSVQPWGVRYRPRKRIPEAPETWRLRTAILCVDEVLHERRCVLGVG